MSTQIIPFSQGFFCDGHWYVITSSSFGGSDLTPEQLTNILTGGTEENIRDLLKNGVCLPLFFDGDCALDNAIVAIGDLTPEQDQEWIGKISSWLNIPCGKLVVVCGGGDSADFERAISGEPPDPHFECFQMIDIPSGEYLVELYAYISSMTVDFYFDENNHDFRKDEPLIDWFNRTRPGMNLPLWLQCYQKQGFIGELSDRLISYILRVKPLDQQELKIPDLVPEIGWCGEFQLRRPHLCPLGILRSTVVND
jgi:hypothetical protein